MKCTLPPVPALVCIVAFFAPAAVSQVDSSGDWDFELHALRSGNRGNAIEWARYPRFRSNRYLDTWGARTVPSYVYLGYGDDYPRTSAVRTTRPHSDISNYLAFQGPGNTNPGNIFGIDSLNDTLRAYIAGQFTYVLFDQESFARRGPNKELLRLMPEEYHREARLLMARNPDLVVLPYFSFPVSRIVPPLFPWWDASTPAFVLRDERDSAFTFGEFALMDVRNPRYRRLCVDSAASIVRRYGYRGIFLDNMTVHPFVRNQDTVEFSRLPADIRQGNAWRDALILLIDSLRSHLPPGTRIALNCLGIDDNPGLSPLYGREDGVDLLAISSADAGLLESFQSTAWRSMRDRAPGIMKRVDDLDKVFLCVASYTRRINAAVNQAFGLGHRNSGGEYDGAYLYVDGPTQENYMPAWNPVFYRMQHSYLARFLLGIPRKKPKAFAYSFQPGFMTYQFVPYYAIWNAPFGVPVTDGFDTVAVECGEALPDSQDVAHDRYIWNATGVVYRREFTNSVVIVNADEHRQVTVEIPEGYVLHNEDNNTPGGPYIYGRYLDHYNGRRYLVLNRNEGVILFRLPGAGS